MFAKYDTVQQTIPPGVNTTDVGQHSTGYTMLYSVSISELDSIDTKSSVGTIWPNVLHEQLEHVPDQLHLQHPIFS